MNIKIEIPEIIITKINMKIISMPNLTERLSRALLWNRFYPCLKCCFRKSGRSAEPAALLGQWHLARGAQREAVAVPDGDRLGADVEPSSRLLFLAVK